jgi:putative ABC transport system permease protein
MPALAPTWLGGLVRRRRTRLLVAMAGVALAVASVAALGAFVANAKATMTRRALARVVVDWQVAAAPGTGPSTLLDAVAAAPGVRVALPVSYATTPGFEATAGGTTQTTGSGVVVGLPDGYAATFAGEIRPLAGGASAGVLLAQQTAANLHAKPGDVVAIGRTGRPPVRVRVDGVVDLPYADSLFQRVGAPAGAQPTAPPDNVLLLPAAQWAAVFGGGSDPVEHQVHARLDRGGLPHDPAAAFTAASRRARHLEVVLAGAGVVGDNLAATLDAARSDALYAQALFLVLGLPGAALAGLLTGAVAGGARDRRRRDFALLRARGAGVGTMTRLAASEASLVAVAGGVAGLLAGAGVGRLAFGSATFGATAATAAFWALLAAGTGTLVAVLTVVVPARNDARRVTVNAARADAATAPFPRVLRLGVDLWFVLLALVVHRLVSRTGYHLVLAPEGVPTVAVSYWALAGPLLLWAGGGLLVWRLVETFLDRGGRVLTAAVRPFARGLAEPVAATLRRARRRLAVAAALFALAVAFAGSTAVFDATYAHQVGVDARLTNGADVTVTVAPAARSRVSAAALAKVSGVTRVEPLLHRYAYVGSDLQDIYGVDPKTIAAATDLQDAYFQGGTVHDLLARLAAQPDALLVSAETVTDFQLAPGDTVRLRLGKAVVPFRYAGVAKEFPTAPRDSFLVANASYLAQRTGDPAPDVYLLTAASPKAVAARVRALLGADATVTDLATTRAVVGSSLTAVDLGGLTRVELGFGLVLAAAASGLVLAADLAGRRRSLALVAALGGRTRQVKAFARAEILVVAATGLLLGAALAWALTELLVKVLTGVFDPPPSGLSVPWAYLGAVGGVAVVAAVLAGEAAVRLRPDSLTETLRDI